MLDSLKQLKAEIYACKKCPLWKTRNIPVVGEGPKDAKIMIIGMGPGKEEDKTGRPFVGRAGKLLNEFLSLAEINRKNIYITNVIKCFLPHNLVKSEYIKNCSPYLDRQIAIIKPKIIIGLGNVALTYLSKKYNLSATTITKLHGREWKIQQLFGTLHIFATFHPAAVLRNPTLKKDAEENWKKIGKRIKEILKTN